MGFHFVPTIGVLVGLPPQIALVATLVFVFFLFRRDIRQRPNVTGALWLPFVWVVLMGSRSIAQWLNVFGLHNLGSAEEGNPLDAVVYLSLIIAGLYVLNQRQVSLFQALLNNGWLMAFILYCLIAIFWSDFPFVALKRWIKMLGHPIMALILFTEPDPTEALVRLMKRSAYVLVPFSILAIKYYPDIGREFDDWTGIAVNVGISQSKNMLGCVCLVLGFFFFCHFLTTWRTEKSRARRNELRLVGVLLFLIAYLLRKSHDATATLCLAFAIGVFFLVGRRWFNKELVGTYAVLAIIGLVAAELMFGVFERVVDLTGHNATMTGRMDLWRDLLALHTNPIFGTGFESFWLGDRLAKLSDARWWQPNEAHNGYLEIYLNLGFVGLFMLFGLIIATFRKIRLDLLQAPDWGRFELGFLAAMLFYNITEATFKGLSLTWFIFFIITMKRPVIEYEPVPEKQEMGEFKPQATFVY